MRRKPGGRLVKHWRHSCNEVVGFALTSHVALSAWQLGNRCMYCVRHDTRWKWRPVLIYPRRRTLDELLTSYLEGEHRSPSIIVW